MAGAVSIPQLDITGTQQFRIIPSRFPPIKLFETLASADELEIAYAIESMSNDRLRVETGNLFLVDKAEWVTGPGASVVMAAFTHIGHESRFSDGRFGVYYAALDEETAVTETVFHRERFLRKTSEPAIEVDMRCYSGKVQQPLDDIRGKEYDYLSDPDINSWNVSQRFGAERRDSNAFGLLYCSARHDEGECVAAFRPKAVSLPSQSKHLRYRWNGSRIDQVIMIENVVAI